MALPPVNQEPYPLDNQILIAVGVTIAGIAIILLKDKIRSRKKTLFTKTITEKEDDNEKKIDESIQPDKKQARSDNSD